MPGTARDEMDALLNMTLTVSQQMLEEHGELYSHGGSIDSSGGLQLAGVFGFLPYTRERLHGIEYGELFAVQGESHVSTSTQTNAA